MDPFDSELDHGLVKDLEEKNAEIKALKEQIEMLTNKAKIITEPLDNNIEDEEEEKEPVKIIKQDPYEMIRQQFIQDQADMAEYLKTKEKPKKKKPIDKQCFELFMDDI